ncbi:MAG: hypothetical protein WBH03_03300, partial [Cyclobacteriaceae bacterium]
MKKTVLILFLLCVSTCCPIFAQSLEIGGGIELDEKRLYSTPVVSDSIVFFGREYNDGGALLF